MGLIETVRHRKGVIAAVAITLAVAVGMAAWEWPAWTASRAARRALAEGRYLDAEAAIKRWVKARPESAEAHYHRARAAIALGNPRELGDSLRRAEKLGYPPEQLAVLRAVIGALRGRSAQAGPVLAKALARADEPDPLVEEALARVYMESYDFANAVEVLDRWTKDAPTDARPPLWRAQVARRTSSKPKEIIAFFRESARRDPKNPDARLGLADALAGEHQNDEAASEYDVYLTLKPNDPAGPLGSGRNALELGDLTRAARSLDRALALAPESADAHFERAKLARRQGDETLALTHLDRAIALKPANPALRYSRKLALTRLGRRAEADAEQRAIDLVKADLSRVDALQSALVKSPKDPTLQYQLANWMFSHGYADEGLTWARKLLNDHPGHPATCALLADYFETKGDLAQADQFRAQSR